MAMFRVSNARGALERLAGNTRAFTLLGIGLALALFFLPALTSDRTFFARDSLRMHGPIRAYVSERLAHGELPLWWSFEALGAPFAAQGVTAVFHPAARGTTLDSCFFAPGAFVWWRRPRRAG
jgi:hypothetical protein